jgi:hypothetical protein
MSNIAVHAQPLDHLTTARVNDWPVVVHLGHRVALGGNGQPGDAESGSVLVTVSAPVPLVVDEVVGVLFDHGMRGCPVEDLADDDFVRELVAESVVNGGCGLIDETRCDEAVVTGEDAELLAYCYQRAMAVFAAHPSSSSAPWTAVGGIAQVGGSRPAGHPSSGRRMS